MNPALFFGLIESVLQHLVHLIETFFLRQQIPEAAHPCPQKGRAFHLRDWKSGAFRHGTLVKLL